jgi:hypothetical protein
MLDGGDIRGACTCWNAVRWREKESTYEKMILAICRLFGENCREIEPSWNPVEEEVYTMLCETAEKVVFVDGLEAVTMKLADSSTAVITYGQIERRMSIRRKAKD